MSLKDKEAHRAYCRAYYYAHDGKNRQRRQRLTREERLARKRARSAEYRKRNAEKIRAYKKRPEVREQHNTDCRRWREKHPDYNHNCYVRRMVREMVDADFYAANRAKCREYANARRARLGLPQGNARPAMRIPDWCVRGGVLDTRSQWLFCNATDEQKAYARELAIERKQWRTDNEWRMAK